MFNITGTDAWVMLMDEYGTGHFFAQMTRDFETFKAVNPRSYKMDHLSPRHGSIVAISMEEYERLVEHYGKDDNGIVTMGICNFLLDENSLDL